VGYALAFLEYAQAGMPLDTCHMQCKNITKRISNVNTFISGANSCVVWGS
jgi:hypothetical protein